MSCKPVLSIVIANYNYGKYLATAIESIISQNVDDFAEIIVCDAASTDDSVAVIKRYESHIAWWCSEKDGGQSAAFNKGFSHACGEYLTWLNADDILWPGALEKIKSAMLSNPGFQWIAGGTVYFDDKGVPFNTSMPGQWQIARFARVPDWLMVDGPSSIFSRKLLKNVGGVDENLHFVMDIDLWMRFSKANQRLYIINDWLWGFRVHEESKTSEAIILNTKNENFERESISIRTKNQISQFSESCAVFRKRICAVCSLAVIRRKIILRDLRGRPVHFAR